MQEITKKTEEVLEIPESFPLKYIEGDEEYIKSFLSGVESVYEILRAGEDDISEIITRGFTREQIWQQIDLLNGKLENMIPTMARWIARQKQLAVPVKTMIPGESENEKVEINDKNDDEKSSEEDDEIEEEESEKDEGEEDDDDKDRFFNIKEMEKFADMEEKDEDLDLFENEDSGSEREDVKYVDFFGEKDDDTGFDENEDSESDPEHKSTFEKRKEALQSRIRKMEDEAIGEKPWVLKGEAESSNRPVNSLLEEVLEFDTAQRPAPVITEEVTMKLEDVIKKRIKDETYDDVERKIKPVKLPHEFKKQIVLDQEKSKLSLAQIYENEFLNQKSKEKKEVKEEELSEEKKKIAEKMKAVFHQLDILCNLHYTPKMGDTELKVVSNIPAINMEEVAPVAMTDADRLAPSEVAGKFKHDLVGKEERTKTDKKREKRKKKALQSKKANWKTSAQNIKINKSNMLQKDDGQSMKTSTAFFNRLQDEVENKKRKTDVEKPRFQAKKLKL